MNNLEALIINEKIVNEALKLALRERDATISIEIFIEFLGQKIGCDRIYIFEGATGETVSNTFEWVAEGSF